MAMAARRPAPPPPTSSTSWAPITVAISVVVLGLGFELVDHHPPVVPHHPICDAAVVHLVVDLAAPAGIEIVVADQSVAVAVLDVLSVLDPATGSFLALELGGR